jgi:hypothetical protein
MPDLMIVRAAAKRTGTVGQMLLMIGVINSTSVTAEMTMRSAWVTSAAETSPQAA